MADCPHGNPGNYPDCCYPMADNHTCKDQCPACYKMGREDGAEVARREAALECLELFDEGWIPEEGYNACARMVRERFGLEE